MTKITTERRTHPRIPASLELQGIPEDGGVVARMVGKDLSLGGLYCTSTADFAEMTRLAVRLMLPTSNGGNGERQPLDLEAVVVRREERLSPTGEPCFDLALFFTNVDNDSREQLSRFLEQSVV